VQFNCFYGPVSFDNAGENYAKVFLTQQVFPDGTLRTITPLESATATPIYPAPSWDERLYVNPPYGDVASQVMLTFACIGVLYCIILAILLFIWRKKPQIVSSSIAFCYLILIGATFAFISCALWTSWQSDEICLAHPILLVLGLDMFLVPLIVKNFRLLILFRRAASLKVSIMPVWHLVVFVGALLVPDIVTLIVWSAAYPQRAVLVQPNLYFAVNWFTFCSSTPNPTARTISFSTADIAFVGTVGAYQGALLIVGIVITFLLRKVPSEFNESRYIGYAIYSHAFCLLLLLIVWQALPLQEWYFAAIAREVVLLWALFVSVSLIFLPKIYFVLTNRKSDLRGSIRSSLNKTTGTTGISDASSFDQPMPSLKVAALEAENAQLKNQVTTLAEQLEKATGKPVAVAPPVAAGDEKVSSSSASSSGRA